MKILKKISVMLLTAGMCVTPTFATEAAPETALETTQAAVTTGYTMIQINADDGLELKDGDVFYIGYESGDGLSEDEIQITAWDVKSGQKKVELPEGSYDIFDIYYQGLNDQIESDGYGIQMDFTVGTDGGSGIVMAIGKNSCESLGQDYGNRACIKDAQHDENGQPITTTSQDAENLTDDSSAAEESSSAETGSEKGSSNASDVSDKSTDPENTSDETPKVEYYNTKDSKKKGLSTVKFKLILVACVAGIGVVGILVVKKKGIF